jgi:glycosyltransferase involved in cell wall biosynthesis
MIRVLHVAQPTDGGVASYVVAAAADQAARGWQVAVACPDGGPLASELARSGIDRFRWAAVRSPGPGTLAEVRRLGRLIEAYQPDLVHLHAAKAGLAGRLHLRGRRPTLFQPHAWSWLAARGALRAASLVWERRAARWTDMTVCVADQEAVQGRESGVRGRYAVIRNGVDLDRFRAAGQSERVAARSRLGLPAHQPLAVCVGRLTRQKGQDVLLASWPQVLAGCRAAGYPEAQLALVGDGDLLPRLRRSAPDKQGAPDGVRFAGAVRDVRDWLVAADVVVLPSRWEGLPLVALEAMATGRSVVGTAIPGLTEVLPAAALVPAEDPAALAGKLIDRLAHPELARREGASAARRATAFDSRTTFDRLAVITAATVHLRQPYRVSLPGRIEVAAS